MPGAAADSAGCVRTNGESCPDEGGEPAPAGAAVDGSEPVSEPSPPSDETTPVEPSLGEPGPVAPVVPVAPAAPVDSRGPGELPAPLASRGSADEALGVVAPQQGRGGASLLASAPPLERRVPCALERPVPSGEASAAGVDPLQPRTARGLGLPGDLGAFLQQPVPPASGAGALREGEGSAGAGGNSGSSGSSRPSQRPAGAGDPHASEAPAVQVAGQSVAGQPAVQSVAGPAWVFASLESIPGAPLLATLAIGGAIATATVRSLDPPTRSKGAKEEDTR